MTEDEIESEFESRVNSEVERKLRPLNWTLNAVAVALVSAHFLILVFVIPKFKEMFDEMDIGELPAPTQLLLGISQTAVHYWWIAIPTCVCGMAALIAAKQRVILIVQFAVLMAAFAFDILALFMPLTMIMDKLSGGG